MEQYKEVYCWKCLKCGRVLTTPGGGKTPSAEVQVYAARD